MEIHIQEIYGKSMLVQVREGSNYWESSVVGINHSVRDIGQRGA